MLGLANYASSGEEEEQEEVTTNTQSARDASISRSTSSWPCLKSSRGSSNNTAEGKRPRPVPTPEKNVNDAKRLRATDLSISEQAPGTASTDVSVGPSIGPSMPPAGEDLDEEASAPSSPYSRARATVRGLTMPPIPNLNIPDSPPGSPPPESTKKFARFLELKKKGVHFNARLEESPALRNPAVLKRLTNLAGIDDVDQYASALPKDIAVPAQFPPGAYFEELNRSQLRLLKKRDAEKGKSGRKIDFVKPAQTGGN